MRGKTYKIIKIYFLFKMENNKFLCFKLKLKVKADAIELKEDLIELILQSEEWQVEPTHSTLIEMARRKKIKKSYNSHKI